MPITRSSVCLPEKKNKSDDDKMKKQQTTGGEKRLLGERAKVDSEIDSCSDYLSDIDSHPSSSPSSSKDESLAPLNSRQPCFKQNFTNLLNKHDFTCDKTSQKKSIEVMSHRDRMIDSIYTSKNADDDAFKTPAQKRSKVDEDHQSEEEEEEEEEEAEGTDEEGDFQAKHEQEKAEGEFKPDYAGEPDPLFPREEQVGPLICKLVRLIGASEMLETVDQVLLNQKTMGSFAHEWLNLRGDTDAYDDCRDAIDDVISDLTEALGMNANVSYVSSFMLLHTTYAQRMLCKYGTYKNILKNDEVKCGCAFKIHNAFLARARRAAYFAKIM